MRRRYEHRVIGVVQRIGGADRVQAEYAVPRASRSIDAVLLLDEAPVAFGSLRLHVASRATALEHFSRSVSPEQLNGPLTKLGFLVEEHWQQPLAERRLRQPLLLLVLEHRPVRLLRALPGVTQLEAGLWSWERPWFGDVVVVVPRELEAKAGNAALKLMTLPRDETEAEEGIERLQADPLLLDSMKVNLLEDLMTGTIPSTADERERIIDRIRREGHTEGRAEGRSEGRTEGRSEGRAEGRSEGRTEGRRELLLEQLRSRFGELPAHALHRVQAASAAELERWGLRVLDAASLADVLDG